MGDLSNSQGLRVLSEEWNNQGRMEQFLAQPFSHEFVGNDVTKYFGVLSIVLATIFEKAIAQ